MGFSLSRTLGVRGDVGNFLTGGNTIGRFMDSGGLLNPANSGAGYLLGMRGGALGSYGGKDSGGGYDSSGKPIQPNYQSQLDSDTYRKMKSRFDSSGNSPWANIATSRQNDMAEQQKQELAHRTQGQVAGSLDKLSAVGGLSSGARERTVQGGQKDYMSGVQNINNALGTNLLNISMQDAQGKDAIGKGLMAAEMGDLSGLNNYNQSKYQADMQAWAANQQANATANSGKKGLFK